MGMDLGGSPRTGDSNVFTKVWSGNKIPMKGEICASVLTRGWPVENRRREFTERIVRAVKPLSPTKIGVKIEVEFEKETL